MRCQALLQCLDALLSCCGTFQALSLLTGQLHTNTHARRSQNVVAAVINHTIHLICLMHGELDTYRAWSLGVM